MTFLTNLWKFIASPKLPSVACALSPTYISMVKAPNRCVEKGLCFDNTSNSFSPSFESTNIPNIPEFATVLKQMAEMAGLGNEKKWVIALPDVTVKMLIVPLDKNISGIQEIEEVLTWKIERFTGASIVEFRVAYCQLTSTETQQRFLVSVVNKSIVKEYESLFAHLGWHTGVLLSSSICESLWFYRKGILSDQILLSKSADNLTILILHNQEPVLFRQQQLAGEDLTDVIHRLLTFYRDRKEELSPNRNHSELAPVELLLTGNWDSEIVAERCVQQVFNTAPTVLSSTSVGFSSLVPQLEFSKIAAAAGLASLTKIQ